ncbi:MAG: OsmC family protein [Verrucomicrobia bacterium]|nr:MAG: OsmC family protein [Verrucomicrobiota bacterium]
MNADELRSLQAPVKTQYRERPETALVTLRAKGRIGGNITCKIETGKARVEAGLHPATGGDGLSACSADMLLEALVGCAGVTLRAVATALGIPLRDATINAEGDLDFRGTLGVSKDVPVGFKQIRLNFDLDTDASAEQIATLLRLTERYCVVYQTLDHPAKINVLHHVIPQ